MRGLALLLLVALSTAGCSSTPSREVDSEKSAQINAELGLRYMMQGKNELALEKLTRALERDESSVDAHHYIAELYRRLGETESANKHYRRAVDLAPENSSLRNNYGVFLCTEKRFKESETQFLAVLTNPVYGGRADTLENLGLCQVDAGGTDKAIAYFRDALQINPRLPQSLLAMADLSYTGGNALSARGYLQRHLEVATHTPRSLWLGIRIERELDNRGAVASYGTVLKRNFPDSEEARLYMKYER